MNFITSTDTLKDFCQSITQEDCGSYIAVDTEFQREDTYWPQLCLIQIAGSRRHALIDPLAKGIDLSPLKALFFDTSIIKVFHAARQDLEIFYHLWGDLPRPLFDTQIAAMACGFGESVGYSNLVEQLANQTIDKTSQFTNWKQRPLSEKQLIYALNDVTYLRIIYEKIIQDLKHLGRLSWIEEEIAFLIDPITYQQDINRLWMSLKPRTKGSRFLAKLREIAIVRDELARDKNVPRSRIIKDQTLLEMASNTASSVKDFDRLRGIPSDFSQKNMAQIFLEALQYAEKLPANECPKFPKKLYGQSNLEPVVELLRVYLKQVSLDHNVAAKMIATNEDLYDIAASAQPNCRAVQGWRYNIFGKEALALKRGEKFLTIKNSCIKLESYQ